jgi:hypothetical protein
LGYSKPLGTRLDEALFGNSDLIGESWRLIEDADCCFPLYLTSDFFVYFAECCGGFPGLRAPVEDCGQ